MRALGMMSGTSLDGLDLALVNIEPRGAGYGIALERGATIPWDAGLRNSLLEALPPNRPDPARVANLDRDLGRRYAEAARAFAGAGAVDFAALHGLTLFHDGAREATMQIGEPYSLRDALEATVVFDFRRADCALGGQGAPLVPYVDALLFAGARTVALNLGGIANATYLLDGEVRASDLGPGTMLIDAAVRECTGGTSAFDRDGAIAAGGSVDPGALETLLRDPFFALAQPKSTGRERFGGHWLAEHAGALQHLTAADRCATLSALTAESVARALRGAAPARVVVSGGGARNPTLLRMLRERLGAGFDVVISDELGIDADLKEAIAFAVLGYETLRGRPANVAGATGARAPAVLGAFAPYDVAALLRRLGAETERAG